MPKPRLESVQPLFDALAGGGEGETHAGVHAEGFSGHGGDVHLVEKTAAEIDGAADALLRIGHPGLHLTQPPDICDHGQQAVNS